MVFGSSAKRLSPSTSASSAGSRSSSSAFAIRRAWVQRPRCAVATAPTWLDRMLSRFAWKSSPRGSATGVEPYQLSSTTVARSEEHTSELQSLMRSSHAVFCLKNTNLKHQHNITPQHKYHHIKK